MTTPIVERRISTSGSKPDAQNSAGQVAPGAVVGLRSRALAGVRIGFSIARRGTVGLLARLPATARATRTVTRGTVGALQALPDPTLRSLAASSVGLGVGLSFTRSRRFGLVAGMVPAVLMGAAIAARPVEPRVPADAGA